jgi:hypothetical protein
MERIRFVSVKIKPEPNEGFNKGLYTPVLCSLWLGDHHFLIHDMSALPSIMQLLR